MGLAGTLTILGILDDKDIDRGFTNIERHQDTVGQKNQSMIGDFTRLGGAVKGVAASLLGIGLSTTGLLALAKDSPALAGAMASLSISMGRIGRALGEGLQGPVNAFSGIMESLANFAESDPGAFAALTIAAGALTSLFGLALVTKGAALTTAMTAIKGIGFSGSAIAGLTLLTGLLAYQNWDDIKGGASEIGKIFAGESSINAKTFSSMSEGGLGSDILEGAKMFFSPLAEIFGADPYTPEGWRSQGEFVKSGRGTDFIRTQQGISTNTRDIVLGQGDMNTQ